MNQRLDGTMKKVLIASVMYLFALMPAVSGTCYAWGVSPVLIEPTTAEATKELIIPEGLGSSLQLTGVLGSGEYITLQRWNGTAWEQLKVDGADAKSLSSTNHVISIYGGLSIRIYKPVTAAAAGVDWRR